MAGAARAEGPEQLYERGPDAGHWRLEYNGQLGRTVAGERSHSLETFRGLTDRLAVGLEVEASVEDGRLDVEELSVGALLALSPEGARIDISMLAKAGIARDGRLAGMEARLIGKFGREAWRALANVIVRRVEGEEPDSSLGYALLVDRALAGVRLGVEVSGRVTGLDRASRDAPNASYAGPSLSVEGRLGDREFELGLKYLRRIDGENPYRDTVRIVAALEF